MPRLSPIFLIVFSLAGLAIACQSEDEKRAGRLREKLHQNIKRIEVVNNKILDARKDFYELRKDWKNGYYARSDLQSLEAGREQFPAELAKIQSLIDTTPNSSLQMVSSKIQGTLEAQQISLKQQRREQELYETTFHPDSLKADREKSREAWRPKIFSGRPEGPLVFGPDGELRSTSKNPQGQNK